MAGSSGLPANPRVLLKPEWKDKPALLIGEKEGVTDFMFLVLPVENREPWLPHCMTLKE